MSLRTLKPPIKGGSAPEEEEVERMATKGVLRVATKEKREIIEIHPSELHYR